MPQRPTEPASSSKSPQRVPQKPAILAMIAAMLFAFVLVSLVMPTHPSKSRSFASYVAQDNAGQPVDCHALVHDLSPRLPVPQRIGSQDEEEGQVIGTVASVEQTSHHTFKACRSEIDAQATEVCDRLTDGLSSQIGWDYDVHQTTCAPAMRASILANAPTLTVGKGWVTIGDLHLQTSQIVSVNVQPIDRLTDDQGKTPAVLVLTTNAREGAERRFVLPDQATAQHWLDVLTQAGPDQQ